MRIVLVLGLLIALFRQSANLPSLGHLLGRYYIGQVRAATTWTVTDTSDSATDTGSLRYALAHAQNGNTITFDPILFSTPQTITLTAALAITANITITGPGATLLTLDGAKREQAMLVNAGVTATVAGMTIANGSSTIANGSSPGNGGGILNDGTLTVQNCTLSGNVAGNGADVLGDPGGDGGAIYNDGTLSISNSTLSGNAAGRGGYGYRFGNGGDGGDGGAIYNDGTLSISNSTLSVLLTT
jgi:hypothetical protein